MSVAVLDAESGESRFVYLSAYFKQAWRTYYRGVKLNQVEGQFNAIMVHKESTGELLKVDLDSKEVFKLEKSLLSSTSRHLVDSARKYIKKFFVNQNQAFKMSRVEGGV